MTGNNVRINTEETIQIANRLEQLNNDLKQELENSTKAVNSLTTIWQGEAAQTTINSYNDFAKKYFQNYADVIKQYVAFLKGEVAPGYSEKEKINTGLGETLK